MTPAAVGKLTLEEYDRQYGHENGWEYWFGEALRKPSPTWYHAILKFVLTELLFRAGYFAGGEIDLKIDPDWQPRPDVLAANRIQVPYPTKPVEAVFEVLSDDQWKYIHSKCEHYARIGIACIYVLDPENRRVWRWDPQAGVLRPNADIVLPNGKIIPAQDVWREFELRIEKA